MKFLVDSHGRIGFDIDTKNGPYKESLFWFGDNPDFIHCADGKVYVDSGWGYYINGSNFISPLDEFFQTKKTNYIVSKAQGTLELEYYCESFEIIDLPSFLKRFEK